MAPNPSSRLASAKTQVAGNKVNSKRRMSNRTPQYILNVQQLGIAVRVGWGWLIILILLLVAFWRFDLLNFLGLLGGVLPFFKVVIKRLK